MKTLRFAVPLLAALLALVLAVRWSIAPRGFPTPAHCLEAYREAILTGDVPAYLDCLGEPLRQEVLRRHPDPQQLAGSLRSTFAEIKNWAQSVESLPGEPAVYVHVEETRVTGIRRVRYRLEPTSRGWLIVAIDPPQEAPASIPFGTHISKVPAEGGK